MDEENKVAAMLAGIELGLPTSDERVGPELNLFPLSVYGAAIRLGVETPKQVRTYLAALSAEELKAIAIIAHRDLLEVRDNGEDNFHVVMMRSLSDVLHGIYRVWLPRNPALLGQEFTDFEELASRTRKMLDAQGEG